MNSMRMSYLAFVTQCTNEIYNNRVLLLKVFLDTKTAV